MLARELKLNKAKNWCQRHAILSLVFEEPTTVAPFFRPVSSTAMPKATRKLMRRRGRAGWDNGWRQKSLSTHGMVNIMEARLHTQSLDRAIEVMSHKIDEGEIQEAMVDTINVFKEIM